jgi:1,4-dihydroxy-2-naphthoyl-CoA synthase
MVKATIQAFRRASVDREVNAVVFTAVGEKAFCPDGNTKVRQGLAQGAPWTEELIESLMPGQG